MNNNQEFILKQIRAVSKLVAKILFKTEDFVYVLPTDSNKYDDFDKLFVELFNLLESNEFNKAEDLLFSKVDGKNFKGLMVALNFYEKLATKTEEELTTTNFSLEEVEQGFFDVLKLHNIRVDKK